ncbi:MULTISPECIES: hemolysin family protein [Pseudomonas]|uniref:hemolysin family protein n=1 Tax=Pseudomonas TaxID=286 RepID=UPI002097D6D0|nr:MULTISPECIES: hemolysin family protein [Pseudomonas]MCO7579142.1 hemolysin family protein [Pseudomonas protegens]MCO7585127.1 hemolysin family protein [Pseudomonas chlororaphis]MCO7602228.1 hemolysin family protein [Pseudomonas chlororaphis]MDC7818879.1 hemolysin family protein [Pseudomonas sp. BLCC-B112]
MIETILTLILGILVMLAIIAVNGYFVAQEFAYMAVDRTRLSALAAAGDTSAKRALAVTNRTSFMLSGAQLGITVTGLLVGYVAEPLVGESLGVLLSGTGIPVETRVAVGTGLALVAATIIQMIVGELYPKNLAIANPEPLSLGLARSTLFYMSTFGWLISFFDKSANLLLKLLRIEPIHDLDVSASATDLPHIIADSRDSGDLPRELSLMMDRILDFPQRNVEHAMVPRSQVDWVEPDTTLEELRGLMARAHTRYPVIDDDDAPVGVVHLADVLARLSTGNINETVGSLMRPAKVLPTLMLLPDALDQLVQATDQLACVIDEYGGFAGVLTIEDLAMEIVGEITDEHDAEVGDAIVSEGENTWTMEGDVHLDEVRRIIGHDLPRVDVETVAGMLIAELGALPGEGDTVTVDLPIDAAELVSDEPVRYRLEVDVLRIERHVPTEVRVRLVKVSMAEEGQ